MSARTKPPFRADHVGSMLRPPELLKARADHKAGTIDDAELRAVEDQAIKDVVKLQEDLGIGAITDGELRRGSWHMDFVYELDGVTRATDDMHIQFHNPAGVIEFTPAALTVDGKIGVSKTIFGDAFAYLQSHRHEGHAQADDPLPQHGPLPRRARGDRRERLPRPRRASGPTSASPTPRRSRGLYDMGCRYLQFDDTSLAYLNDPEQRA